MAGLQNTSSVEQHSFDKELNKDVGNIHLPPNSWGHARNAINNSKTGDLGKLGNEPANELCSEAPYTIIGAIHLEADKWAIFSTNSTGASEIGLFIEGCCKYKSIVNDLCLKFSTDFLIKGVSRATGQCNFELYWDDSNNLSRSMTIIADNICDPIAIDSNVYTNPNSPVPWLQICTDSNNVSQTSPGVWPTVGSPPIPYVPVGCVTCANTPALNCDKIRLAKLIDPICAKADKGPGAGTLPNGSYMVAIAYTISEQKVSDYYVTNVVGLFDHDNTASSLEVTISSADKRFSEMTVVLISMVNQQTVAHKAGIYSTRQTRLSFDVIGNTWPSVPIEQLPIMTPIANKSDAMYNTGPYLIRIGPTSKEDFNYQPLANHIRTKWVSVEYDVDYYRKAGINTGYMRDEVYPFFVRWIYDTGDKSASYHIPGRPPIPLSAGAVSDLATSGNFIVALDGGINRRWNCENTASTVGGTTALSLPDGGVQIREGYMGYWESSEFYPDDKPQIWNPSVNTWSIVPATTPYSGSFPFNAFVPADYDLCGKPIRHHKFPEDNLNPDVTLFNSGSGTKIRIMGIKFENVLPPRDNTGAFIPGIIGYEILRGTRNGNKSVIAKGIINNMGQYVIPGGATSRTGAYPNYPYNDLQPDPFLTTASTTGPSGVLSVTPGNVNSVPLLSNFSRSKFTFHSPETNFTNPYLSAKELKVYGEVNGKVIGKFEKSEKHPKEKFVTDFAFLMAAIGGIGIANLAMNGQKLTVRSTPKTPGYSVGGQGLSTAIIYMGHSVVPGVTGAQVGESPKDGDAIAIPISSAALSALNIGTQAILASGGALGLNLTGANTEILQQILLSAQGTATTTQAFPTIGVDITQEEGASSRMGPFSFFAAIPMFTYYFTEGTDSILEFIKSICRYRDFALRYHSHGFYDKFQGTTGNGGRPWRREVTEQQYLGPQLTDFGTSTRINNLYRNRSVALELTTTLPDPTINDRTRFRVSDTNPALGLLKDPTKFEIGAGTINPSVFPGNAGYQTASSHYVALKQRIRNQYGQLTNIVQTPIPGCIKTIVNPNTGINFVTSTRTEVLFGGDVYIGRYTEKNTFFYFYDWLYDQPDGSQLDYHTHEMVAYPRYWGNFNEFETGDFTTSLVNAITTGGGTINIPLLGTFNLPPSPSSIWASAVTPSDYFCLDGWNPASPSFTNFSNFKFSVQNAWFYLFNSGVRDFFVESEINLDYRDYGNNDSEVHYDPLRYTDTKALFDTAIIKSGNYYKYDQSLSIAKLFFNYASWGQTQLRDYDPFLAETCFTYRPRRAIYSLPAQFEGRADNWLIFLANNYYDFLSKVTCIKPINKNGAVILFDSASPVEFQGTDQLQTSLGVKLTIGDGGLFSQPLQQLTNADRPYEYGSCQDRLSVINTPAGVFWMSQNQGKIFNLTNGMQPISDKDLKWWFAEYLPYKLTVLFPTFQLIDNPVAGIGCQAIYDNENGLAYFCKKDYILRPGYTASALYHPITNTNPTDGNIGYLGSNNFVYIPTGLQIELGDPLYFEDASWTVSYDPKTGGWLGWHDWHPELLLPGKNTFMSTFTDPITKKGGIWKHNERCDLYCNYYGVDYPFEIEYMVNTPQQINTLRSIEYYMEVYNYDTNCYDRFHVLDYNFDDAVIYNTEQCSGLLRMTPNPRPDPLLMIQYPVINPTFIEILFSKVENKYRFNQFWDITDDRGEYPLYPLAAGPQRMIWNTGANGYVKNLNPLNLNYNKAELQRKKFRHYTNSVFLRKRVIVGQQMRYKMLIMLTNNKQLYSPR